MLDELSEKIRNGSWWGLLKALPMDGGPSSTKFVYLAASGVICGCLALMAVTFCAVYAFTKEHTANVVVAGLLGTSFPAVIAFASNSLNQRRTVNAQTTIAVEAAKADCPTKEGV